MGCPSASTPKYLAQIAATGVSVAGACATGIAAAGICDRCDGAARHIGPIRLSQDRPAQTGGELLPPAAAVPVSLRTVRENWRPHCATQPTLGRSPTKPAAFPGVKAGPRERPAANVELRVTGLPSGRRALYAPRHRRPCVRCDGRASCDLP